MSWRRVKQATVIFNTPQNGIHSEGFPASSYIVANGCIHIETPGGVRIIPINDNLRQVQFDTKGA